MDMEASSGHHHQEMGTHSLESMLVCSKPQQQDQRKPRPQPEQALNCPRCDSTNTKFCYYNNYSLSQPRYFCKSCRRYWTKGGTLRNVPVGGGCRKNKRSSPSPSSPSPSPSPSSSKRSQDQPLLIGSNTNPLTNLSAPLSYYDTTTNDLNLAFARLQNKNGGQFGFDYQHDFSILGNPTTTSTHCDILGNPSISSSRSATTTPSFLDALRSGYLDSTQNNFQNLYYGIGNGGNMGDVNNHHHQNHHHDHDNHDYSAEMLMPFGDHHHHHHRQMSSSTNASTTAVTVTTMKQELCNGREQSESNNNNKVLWGFPWQLNNNAADAGINNNELNSTWHGLLNSPLM